MVGEEMRGCLEPKDTMENTLIALGPVLIVVLVAGWTLLSLIMPLCVFLAWRSVRRIEKSMNVNFPVIVRNLGVTRR